MDNQSIPAIPTRYNDVQYRSRTETRTAVFFDYFGVRHEYEPRKFQLGDIVYIPDFWLPDYEMWVEMKGLKPTLREKEKARRLFQAEGHPVLIMSGIPYAYEREVWTDPDDYGETEQIYDPTGEPEYHCLLFARMVDIDSRQTDKWMNITEHAEFLRTRHTVTREYDAEISDVAWVWCAECECLCLGDRIEDEERGREWYFPLFGCHNPYRHVYEIDLLDWKMQQAYQAARKARFE